MANVLDAVRVAHVSKQFDGVAALNDVSLSVADNEFVALVGPSGCGKSTLLNIIAGLDKPTLGQVFLTHTPAMVFQEAALFPWRTIRDNVAFGLEMQGVAKKERRARADDALRMVHLSQFGESFAHTLSGGMRQRAALARALVADTKLLLMDEPFSALDAQTRALLQNELVGIYDQVGTAIVLVTHSLDEALLLADKIVLLSARPGQIVGEFAVDIPRPRDPATDPRLAALRLQLSGLLSEEIKQVAERENAATFYDI